GDDVNTRMLFCPEEDGSFVIYIDVKEDMKNVDSNATDATVSDTTTPITTTTTTQSTTIMQRVGNKYTFQSLLGDVGRKIMLKSMHNTYLFASSTSYNVKMALDKSSGTEWTIADFNGKISLTAFDGFSLKAHKHGSVDEHSEPNSNLSHVWTPYKNDDGTWSFLSAHGEWLSARSDGRVLTAPRCGSSEHFSL
ncbi:hypothetical protein PENTCL1PPCAC_8187, partial [Pristionchus entomophagus]